MLVKYDLDDKGTGHVFERKLLIANEKSEYQKIEISDLDILGRVLVLDDIIQLSELDCDRYHETFAHVPMACAIRPKRALILGGGDGILAKELLKYPDLEVDMVDIDESVCKLSELFLDELNGGALSDERLNLFHQDALEYCANLAKLNPGRKYDVIYADITDPHPDSPSKSLLSSHAIFVYKSVLVPGGILVAQTDNVQIAPHHRVNISEEFSKSFSNVGDFSIVALTLSSLFSFVWASDEVVVRPKAPPVETNWLTLERSNFCFELLDLALGEK